MGKREDQALQTKKKIIEAAKKLIIENGFENVSVDDITKLTYNGQALTSSDVADAAAWGLGAGHIILWLRANAVKTSPRTITLAGDGYDAVAFTITVADAA